MKKLFLLSFLVSLAFFCNAKDMFRVHETVLVEMSDEVSSNKVRLAVNDMLAVKLPESSVFLKGLALEIKIPKAVAEYRDAIAFCIYTNMTPTPTPTTIDYAGEKLFLNTFPGRLSYNLQIPLITNHNLKETPYSAVLPHIVDIKEGWVYFRLQLVMKGTPVSVLEAEFDIEVKPIVIDKGLLTITTEYPDPNSRQKLPLKEGMYLKDKSEKGMDVEKKAWSVFVNEKQAKLDNGKILLPAGVHHVAVVSDYYRSEVRTVTIEQAHIVNLVIPLEDNEPLLFLTVPPSVSVSFDDLVLENFEKPYQISEGMHVIRFVLDGYETVKTLEAFRGKTYTAQVSFDLLITED